MYNTCTLMSYELSPLPSAFFDYRGYMRLTTSKVTLKNALKVETARRTQTRSIEMNALNGCAVLWVIPRPHRGSLVRDSLDRFRKYLHKRLLRADVFLVCDRYVHHSTKDVKRASKQNRYSRVYTLTNTTCLPAQLAVLTVSKPN